MMNDKLKFNTGMRSGLFWIFSAIYLLYHFLSLCYNPLPWFDEVHLAGISQNLLEHGNFIPKASSFARENREALTYGPLYFLFTGLSIKLFGFGIFQFRIITLLFGFLCIRTTYKIVARDSFSPALILMIAIMAMDPFLNLSMHEGRMDLVAVFFVLHSLYFLLKEFNGRNISISGLYAALAMLTTPRSSIILAAVFVLLIVKALENQKPLLILNWLILPAVLYGAWVFYAFGGPLGYLKYYQDLQGHPNGVDKDYIGGRGYIPKQEVFLILITCLSVLVKIFREKSSYFSNFRLVCFLAIALFYLIVLDWGPYSVFILPIYYILIFDGFTEERLNFRNPVIYLAVLLFFFNSGYLSLKAAQVFSQFHQRDYHQADAFVKEHIPAGSKVVGDAMYYYSVERAGSVLQLMDKYNELEAREKIHSEVYDYDYLIVTDHALHTNAGTVNYYLQHGEFRKVAELKIPESHLSKLIAQLKLVSSTENSGYNAVIYVRIKNLKAVPVAILNNP